MKSYVTVVLLICKISDSYKLKTFLALVRGEFSRGSDLRYLMVGKKLKSDASARYKIYFTTDSSDKVS